METYKGTDKDMRCHGGYQYELGTLNKDDGAIRCDDKGFHSCEAPFDVLRYFPLKKGNRYFLAEAGGIVDRTNAMDSKMASSELTIKEEIGLRGLINAQITYTRKEAKKGTAGGKWSSLASGNRNNLAGGNQSNLAGGVLSNLAGGDWSNLAGGDWSNLAGGNQSNLTGGDWSNLASGDWSNLASGAQSSLAGGVWSNLAGGKQSNLAGGKWSSLAGGDRSNLTGGDWSNLAGGNQSNLAGGSCSLIVGGNGARAKADIGSLIVLVNRQFMDGAWHITSYKAELVDGKRIRADTWYQLVDGEFQEVPEYA